jgi:phospholipase C
VVVLMLENRSFDHVLGALQAQIPALDGISPAGPRRSNPDPSGQPVQQLPGAGRSVDPDPKHENANVLYQLQAQMGRFVKDYARSYPPTKRPQWQEVMAYHDTDTLPALHALAQSFAVCDKWFASVPGPTWTNRLFAMSGTSQGRVHMPAGVFHPNLHRYDQPSIFRRLEEAKRSCRIYFGDFPLALLLKDRRDVKGAKSFARFSRFATDAAGPEPAFPDFTWIEPDYLGGDANDDHPPHDVLAGQALVARVYEAIRANRALFESTLLVVTYDEHGGFYDHVSPQPATPPDAHAEEYTFDRLGVRVPAVCISPWLLQQVADTTIVDHTSLLRSLQLRWKLGAMGNRVAGAPDLFSRLRLAAAPRTDVPSLPKPKAMPRAARALVRARSEEQLSGNEQAIVAFSSWLDAQTPAPPAAKARALKKVARGPRASREVATQRALQFLRAKRGRP